MILANELFLSIIFLVSPQSIAAMYPCPCGFTVIHLSHFIFMFHDLSVDFCSHSCAGYLLIRPDLSDKRDYHAVFPP
jgi:hypothetical protein